MFVYGMLAASLIAPAGLAADRTVVTVETSRGASQSFLFALPANPKAAAILFVGGDGVLGLKSSGRGDTDSKNFLIRIFDDLVRAGVMTAAVDAPGNMRKASPEYRVSDKAAADTAAVISYLKAKTDVPVWLIGTSMGTFSAANAAIREPGVVGGLILTSTITVSPQSRKLRNEFPRGVADMDLPALRIPVLILAHKQDRCASSPPSGAELLRARITASPRVEITLIDGGKRPKSGDCEPLSPHGYFGVEDEATRAITTFMLR